MLFDTACIAKFSNRIYLILDLWSYADTKSLHKRVLISCFPARCESNNYVMYRLSLSKQRGTANVRNVCTAVCADLGKQIVEVPTGNAWENNN